MFARPSELYFASRESLFLHGHGAVAAEHSDTQLLLSLLALLVPFMNGKRLKRGYQCHLKHTRITEL